MNVDKDIHLISCHITNDTQLQYLKNLVEELISKNKKFVLSSHTLLPMDIISKSVGFVYDSINPIYKRWQFDTMPFYSYYTDSFEIQSQYISYGSSDYYHVGAIRLLINGIKYIQTLSDIEVVHWIEYDSMPLFDEEEKNLELLKSYDFIFYGIGSRFSFLIDKVSSLFINQSNDQILENLEKNHWVAEKLIDSMLTYGNKKFIDVGGKNQFWGKYDQYLSNDFDWCLFEHDNKIKIYINNPKNDTHNLEFKINDNVLYVGVFANSWHIFDIEQIGNLKRFEIIKNNISKIKLDFNDQLIYNNVIKKVRFILK